MKLSDGRGIKSPAWFTNEMLRGDDINAIGISLYQSVVDTFGGMIKESVIADCVMGGLEIVWSTALTMTLKAGIAISKQGSYLEADTWGFIPEAGKMFVVVVPEDVLIGLVAGGTYDRVDVLLVRPVINTYNAKTRNFKDPITGFISTALVDTRKEYVYEFTVLKGDDTNPILTIPERTAGWIKLAEINVAASATSITQNDIVYFNESENWLEDVSSTIDFFSLTPIAYTPAVRNADGCVTTEDPLNPKDAINKSYLDGIVNSIPVDYEIISSDTALTKKGKYLIDTGEVTLPVSLSVGSVIELLINKASRILQSHASSGISYKNRFFTTKGVYVDTVGIETGYLQTKIKNLIRMVYTGLGHSRINPVIKITDPTTSPAGTGVCSAFSPDGNYLAVAHYTSPYLTIYKKSGDTFTYLTGQPDVLPASVGFSCVFSPDGNYLVVGFSTTSPFMYIYKRSGDTFVKLTDPVTPPTGNVFGFSFTPNGKYLAVAHYTSPFISVYSRVGDTFTKLPNPASLPAGNGFGCAFSPDGNYLAEGVALTPFIAIYKRAGEVYTKLANPDVIPTGAGHRCSFSPDGKYLAIAHYVTPFVTIYKQVGDSFIKLANPADLPTGSSEGCSFSPDGSYLVIAHATSPFVTVYKHDGDEFVKMTNPATLPSGQGYDASFSPDSSHLVISHALGLFMTIYKTIEDITNAWVITQLDVSDDTDKVNMFK